MRVQRTIHRRNPFDASREADSAGRAQAKKAPARTQFFAEREVLNPDGTFPFGEGFLYDSEPKRRDPSWKRGRGVPGSTSTAGNRGSKPEQQDSYGAVRFVVREHEVAVLVAADGVSASGDLAKPASKTASDVFMERLRPWLEQMPEGPRQRHAFVEKAIERAAFAANFEVIRQVLLDQTESKGFDREDKALLKSQHGITVPTRKLTVAEMRVIAPQLDGVIEADSWERDRTALTTFAAAIVVDNDVYTFSCGDAVVGLYRPTEEAGQRFVHLTHRDQVVVELFQQDDDAWRKNGDVYENVITDSFGGRGPLTGTIRRYPDLLEPDDRLITASDGLGPRGGGEGLTRVEIEQVVEQGSTGLAQRLVKAQMKGLNQDEYQDNIGLAVLEVASPD